MLALVALILVQLSYQTWYHFPQGCFCLRYPRSTPHSREADRYRYERSDLILTEEGPLSTFEGIHFSPFQNALPLIDKYWLFAKDWPDIETSL